MRKRLYNEFIADHTLHLVIGEGIPDNIPEEFHIIKLYIRDKDNNLKLYSDISLPYSINYSKFENSIGDDYKYIFKEEYDFETKKSKYACMLKPLGDDKGLYRIFNDKLIKIQSIEPLCNIELKSVSENRHQRKRVY